MPLGPAGVGGDRGRVILEFAINLLGIGLIVGCKRSLARGPDGGRRYQQVRSDVHFELENE